MDNYHTYLNSVKHVIIYLQATTNPLYMTIGTYTPV